MGKTAVNLVPSKGHTKCLLVGKCSEQLGLKEGNGLISPTQTPLPKPPFHALNSSAPLFLSSGLQTVLGGSYGPFFRQHCIASKFLCICFHHESLSEFRDERTRGELNAFFKISKGVSIFCIYLNLTLFYGACNNA